MKISEMTNDQATECLIRLSEPIANICDNDDIVALLSEMSLNQKLPRVQSFGRLLPKLVTFALKDHKRDVYEIVAALRMTSVEKLGSMNFKETIKEMQDSYDEILRDFFTSSARARKSDAKE